MGSTINCFLGIIQRIFQWVACCFRPILLLIIRLWMARIFFNAGMVKIKSWDTTLMLFSEHYRVPLLPSDTVAVMATSFELVCPVLLIIGLMARLAALPLFIMTLVIEFSVFHSQDHFYWTVLLATILCFGPGNLSIDAWIKSRFKPSY